MNFRKRGSRDKSERISAHQWLGHRRMFLGHGNRACLPAHAPQIVLEVLDEKGLYDQSLADELDRRPEVGEAFVFGPHLLVGTHSGPQIMSEGDYLVKRPDGSIDVLTAGQIRAGYRRAG